MVIIAGIVLLAFGLIAGAALVLAPFALLPGAQQGILWVLFPLLSLAGYLLFVVPASPARIGRLSRLAGSALLALALLSAGALLLSALSLVASGAGTASLWYVMSVGLVLGSTALLAAPSGERGA